MGRLGRAVFPLEVLLRLQLAIVAGHGLGQPVYTALFVSSSSG